MIRRRATLAWGAVGVLALGGGLFAARRPGDDVSCGPGFVTIGPRCCPSSATGDACETPTTCPPPLVRAGDACDAPDVRVSIPETSILVGPSDWEAEGRVAPRVVHTRAFAIDAFEATEGHVHGATRDRARAASGLTREEAMAYCAVRSGRLPTEDEWIVAAAGSPGCRYPWGDTGAVCRRAAWGLAFGPCSTAAKGPDTVGAHADGDTPTGIHDLAGNVAEWVAAGSSPAVGVARGGSWQSSLATDLRTWARLEVDPGARDARIGVRCAYGAL